MLLVIDAANYLIRNIGGYGFRAGDGNVLQTSTGIETGMLLGAINSFIALQNRFKPSSVVFCFDAGRSTFRLGIRKEYKSNRDKNPGAVELYDLGSQFGMFEEFLDILNIARTRERGVEADDFIAAFAKQATEPVVVLSADHDLVQLVTSTVSVLKPAQGRTEEVMFDPIKVVARYGLPAHMLPQMWALMGDTGDGIAGIPKVGPVTATKMIKEYGHLYGALANDPKCEGYEKQVDENFRMIKLDGTLATIPEDLDVSFTPSYPEELRDFFAKYELYSLVRKFDQKGLWKDE